MRRPSLLVLLTLSGACGGASTGAATTADTLPAPPCPNERGLCLVFPEAGLTALEIVELNMGVEVDGGTRRVESDDGVFFAALPAGGYRVRRVGQRFHGFTVRIEDARVDVDTRSPSTGGGTIVGHVRIEVGGGADGNTTISQGGPGSHLVASIIPFVSDQELDRTRVRFAITDAQGRFEVRVPAGRYYVSDISEQNETGVHVFGPNMTPIAGQEVVVAEGETVGVELVAHEAAP